MSCDTLPETEPTIKRFRCGDTREDGKMFWAYQKNCAQGEYWVSPEQFLRLRDSVRASAKRQVVTPEAKLRRVASQKEWCRNNAERIRKLGCARAKRRRVEDPVYAMRCRVRSSLAKSLRKRRLNKAVSTVSAVGMLWKNLPAYIESLFLPGMTWGNRGEWEVDHIVPLALAKTEQDVLELSHYSNLRPLWKKDNLLKSDSLPPRELVPAHLLRFIDPSS